MIGTNNTKAEFVKIFDKTRIIMLRTNNTKPKFVKIFYNTIIRGSHKISTKKLAQFLLQFPVIISV